MSSAASISALSSSSLALSALATSARCRRRWSSFAARSADARSTRPVSTRFVGRLRAISSAASCELNSALICVLSSALIGVLDSNMKRSRKCSHSATSWLMGKSSRPVEGCSCGDSQRRDVIKNGEPGCSSFSGMRGRGISSAGISFSRNILPRRLGSKVDAAMPP